MRIIKSTDQENQTLAGVPGEILDRSLSSEEDREFLNSLLLRFRPKKILEVGVHRGGSSALILNAIKGDPEAHLYAIDKRRKSGDQVDIGVLAEKYLAAEPALAGRYHLFTGGIACEFLDEIGPDLDFCFIGTMHIVPGEILDFLMVLPYLRDGAVVVLHDTAHHTLTRNEQNMVNRLLMAAIKGEKLVPPFLDRAQLLNTVDHPLTNLAFRADFLLTLGRENPERLAFPNIEGVILDKSLVEDVYSIFSLLTLSWVYNPTDEQLRLMRSHFQRFYDDYSTEFFSRVVDYKKTMRELTGSLAELLDGQGGQSQPPVYIYGSGQPARSLARLSRDFGLPFPIKGFLAENEKAAASIEGLPVRPLEEPRANGEKPLLIIAAGDRGEEGRIEKRCLEFGYRPLNYRQFVWNYLMKRAENRLEDGRRQARSVTHVERVDIRTF